MQTETMSCGEFADRLDDYVDAALTPDAAAALERHAAECTACGQRVERETRLRELLQDYGESFVSVPDAEYFRQALAQAAADGARQQRNRWLMTTLAGGIAAGVAILVVGGMLFRTPAPLPVVSGPTVTMTPGAPRDVNLVFTAAEALPGASLTLELPAGVDVAGFPGERRLSWQTSLVPGRNRLPLTLVADGRVDAYVRATLVHGAADRTFSLRVRTIGEPPG